MGRSPCEDTIDLGNAGIELEQAICAQETGNQGRREGRRGDTFVHAHTAPIPHPQEAGQHRQEKKEETRCCGTNGGRFDPLKWHVERGDDIGLAARRTTPLRIKGVVAVRTVPHRRSAGTTANAVAGVAEPHVQLPLNRMVAVGPAFHYIRLGAWHHQQQQHTIKLICRPHGPLPSCPKALPSLPLLLMGREQVGPASTSSGLTRSNSIT